MAVAPDLPNNVRVIIGLEPLNTSSGSSDPEDESNGSPANAQDTEADGLARRHSNESDNIKFGNNEVSFERGLNVSYL